jgi:HlyD family secretion protein
MIFRRFQASPPDQLSVGSTQVSSAHPENGAVSCLGRIEPQDGVLRVTAAYLEGRPQRVRELMVKQDDRVRAGQQLAILDGKEQLQTLLHLAEARVDLARTRLTQVKAGARASDVAAQKAQISELQATLENARLEYHRYELLHKQTDVSSAELDARRLAVQTTEQKLQEAEERLKSISEVRPTDVDVADSELLVAIAQVSHARAQLANAIVYSPATGRVLKIHAYPGEEVGPEGILDLGKTDSMYVEAEVDEGDIARVRTGQRAVITGELFEGNVSGQVETVGTTIAKSDVLPLDPVAFADARVFKVRIRLDDGSKLSNFINGKVNVVIRP